MQRLGILFLCFFSCLQLAAQNHPDHDSITVNSSLSNRGKIFIAPVILVGAGLIATTDNEIFDRWEVKEARDKLSPSFRTRVDNYLQFTPIVAVYGLNAFGIKGKNDFANRTVLLLKSELVMMAFIFPLKKITAITRPDGSSSDSFPSGHTAEAFMAATFLHKEYGEDHPWLSVAAYTMASGVGVLRIMNDRHWLSDVLVGAGIGVLSTNLAYMTHQYRWGKHKKKLQVRIVPTFGQGVTGMYISIPVR